MPKKFKTFADGIEEAKTVSDFDFKAFRDKMEKVARDVKRHQARAIMSAKEVFIGR